MRLSTGPHHMEPGTQKCPATVDLHPAPPSPRERTREDTGVGQSVITSSTLAEGLHIYLGQGSGGLLFWRAAASHRSRPWSRVLPATPRERTTKGLGRSGVLGEGKGVPSFPECLLWARPLPAPPFPMEGLPFAFHKRKLSPRERKRFAQAPPAMVKSEIGTQLI